MRMSMRTCARARRAGPPHYAAARARRLGPRSSRRRGGALAMRCGRRPCGIRRGQGAVKGGRPPPALAPRARAGRSPLQASRRPSTHALPPNCSAAPQRPPPAPATALGALCCPLSPLRRLLGQQHLELGAAAVVQHGAVEGLHRRRRRGRLVELDIGDYEGGRGGVWGLRGGPRAAGEAISGPFRDRSGCGARGGGRRAPAAGGSRWKAAQQRPGGPRTRAAPRPAERPARAPRSTARGLTPLVLDDLDMLHVAVLGEGATQRVLLRRGGQGKPMIAPSRRPGARPRPLPLRASPPRRVRTR
jgi:hypothetical protein